MGTARVNGDNLMADDTTMLLGIQPTGWTNDDFQEIGDDTPYQVILDETAEAGFAGGSTGHNYPSHVPSLLHALKSRKLRIAATWASTTFTTDVDRDHLDASFEEFKEEVAYLEEVGAEDVVVAELANAVNQVRSKSVLTDRPILNEAEWYLLTSQLNRAGQYAAKRDMQLSYHPHVGTGVMTVHETERLLDSTDRKYVGLCLDTAHLRYGGATQKELEDFTKKYATRITHVHLKNVRRAVLPVAVSKKYSFYQAIMSGIFTVPGDPDGDLDLDPIVQILKGVKYNRWMVIEAEQNPDQKTTSLDYARIARGYLRKLLGY
jgi:inosose dehydratase